MPTMEELIKIELKDTLGHEPTALEQQSLSEYVAACKIKWLVDIELAIMNWKNEKTVKCEWCGDRYLPEEMVQTVSGTRLCSDQCAKDYQEEHGVQ